MKYLIDFEKNLWVVWLMFKYKGAKPAIRLLIHSLNLIRRDIALAGVHRRYIKMRYGKNWRRHETNS